LLDEDDLRITSLRRDIQKQIPDAEAWLSTPHNLLGGETPESRLEAGDYDSVHNLFESILYIGIS